MSDLRSEMVNKVLNQWENVPMHTSNKSVAVASKQSFGERIFEFVRTHPYASVDEIERGLGVDKKASVSSYLKAQIDKGLLAREEKLRMPYPGIGSRYYYVYYHISDSYTLPHKPRKPRVDKKVKAIKEPMMLNEPLNDLLIRPRTREEIPQSEMYKHNPETFVSNLTMREARALYDALKSYFGG